MIGSLALLSSSSFTFCYRIRYIFGLNILVKPGKLQQNRKVLSLLIVLMEKNCTCSTWTTLVIIQWKRQAWISLSKDNCFCFTLLFQLEECMLKMGCRFDSGWQGCSSLHLSGWLCCPLQSLALCLLAQILGKSKFIGNNSQSPPTHGLPLKDSAVTHFLYYFPFAMRSAESGSLTHTAFFVCSPSLLWCFLF